MIKIEIDKGRGTIDANGDVLSIVADVCFALNSIRNCILASDSGLAENFKDMIIHVVSDPSSPVWTNTRSAGIGYSFVTPPPR